MRDLHPTLHGIPIVRATDVHHVHGTCTCVVNVLHIHETPVVSRQRQTSPGDIFNMRIQYI